MGKFLLALTALIVACTPQEPPADKLTLSQTRFADIAGWAADRQGAALAAFKRSCGALLKKPDSVLIGANLKDAAQGIAGTVADWRNTCIAASDVSEAGDAAARRFFERYFIPFLAANGQRAEGLFTGYFEIELRGARKHGGRYIVPLYRRPPDLVTVELGRFRPSLKGERIAGRVANGSLKPYPSRAAIDSGALRRKGLELVWVDDPVAAFFLQIQGSGRVKMADDSLMRVGYAGHNGHAYTSIGRELIRRGALDREAVSMQSIRAWLAANPAKSGALMAKNASFIFFRELDGDGPVGSQGVALIPGRSLAVDRRFVPLGVPVWLDTADPLDRKNRLRRLLIAQDTGGAIRGPVRGDVFWGHGPLAAARAGQMKERGSYYLLLPRAVAARLGQPAS